MNHQLLLATTLITTTLGIGVLTPSVDAASFDFSYSLLNGSIISGILEGEIQDDNDTVVVSAITMPLFNGSPAPALSFIDSWSNFHQSTGFLPVVSLSGTPTNMDFVACETATCNEGGFGFDGRRFLSPSIPTVFSFPPYGDTLEAYDQTRWSLIEISVTSVPEPSHLIALLSIGGSLFLRKKIKR